MLPQPDETRAILRSLIDDWRVDSGQVEMGVRRSVLIGLSVYGLTAHTYTLAQAVLTLCEHDQHVAAVPLIREAIECSTTAVWIELSGYPAALAVATDGERARRVRAGGDAAGRGSDRASCCGTCGIAGQQNGGGR